MAAVDEVNLIGLSGLLGSEEEKRAIIARGFWLWYHNHLDDRITTVKIWFFSKTVYVRDLQQIFILLFGPEQ